MLATRPRGKSGRYETKTSCGRRNCRVCTRWRPIIDFGVKRWDNAEKTRPRYLKSECHDCCALMDRQSMPASMVREARRAYYRSHERQRKLEREKAAERARQVSIEAVRLKMCPTNVATAWSEEEAPAATSFNVGLVELTDPPPVVKASACVGCWQRAGVVCVKCPQKPEKKQIAKFRKDLTFKA
jgi:hypothetical protein